MAHECSLTHGASSLSESLRDLGYSLETAIADLTENSVLRRRLPQFLKRDRGIKQRNSISYIAREGAKRTQ